MLVVDSVVPGSCAEGLLEPGDVVIRVERRVVTHFIMLESILDDAVGSSVSLSLERGGHPVQVNVQVGLAAKIPFSAMQLTTLLGSGRLPVLVCSTGSNLSAQHTCMSNVCSLQQGRQKEQKKKLLVTCD